MIGFLKTVAWGVLALLLALVIASIGALLTGGGIGSARVQDVSALAVVPFLGLVHGIRTRLSDPAWPWAFEVWAAQQDFKVVCQTEHYWAGPFPRLNHWLINPLLARAFARRLELAARAKMPISLVGHSNGTNIVVKACQRLAERGIDVDTLVLIGSSVAADVHRSGLLDLVDRGAVRRVIAYTSQSDQVVQPLEWFPGEYGSLGFSGFRDGDKVFGQMVMRDSDARGPFITRLWPDAGHSGYFHLLMRDEVFACLAMDLGLSTPDTEGGDR